MSPCPLAPLLLATATLLLGTGGCAQQNEPTPAAGTASFKLDGVRRTCTATGAATVVRGVNATDELTVTLVTTPAPASGRETLTLYYLKGTGQPVGAFQSSGASYASQGRATGVTCRTAPLTQTASGGLAGTFVGTFAGATGQGSGAITEGAFTEVHP